MTPAQWCPAAAVPCLQPGEAWYNPGSNRKPAPKSPSGSTRAPLEIPQNPVDFATQLLAFPIDPIQTKILAEPGNRVLINCTRQWGKSTTAAIKALHHSLTTPRSLTIIAAPTLAQSAGILEIASQFAAQLDIRTTRAQAHRVSIQFPNGSRILAVPGHPRNRRGLSGCGLLIVDEAAYCSDDLFTTLTPTLATTNGALWLLSTPFAKKGFFWQAWDHPTRYAKFTVPATDCPRISREFLEEEKSRLGPARFESEYLCRFISNSSSVFDLTAIDNAGPLKSLPPWTEYPSDIYIGFDLGQVTSHSAVTILRRRREDLNNFDNYTGQRLEDDLLVLEKAELIPLGQSYESTIDRLKTLIGGLRRDARETVTLAFDATGAGSVFCEQLLAAGLNAQLCPIVITDGSHPTMSNGRQRVPRNDLFESLSQLLSSAKLRVLKVPGLDDLRSQLESFQIDVRNRKPRYTASGKDDLVLSLALAAWRARNNLKQHTVGPQSSPLPLW